MAVACGHQVLSPRTHETNGTRGLGDSGEVTVGDPSQALIQCECAFTYMNAVSGENLSSVFLPMKSRQVSRTTPAAHSVMLRT